MSHKSARIASLVESLQGRDLDARYLGYFNCFNHQQFYEAHEVLEDLWLEVRFKPDGDFYKALIQLAGAFVHFQKSRKGPAAALLKLASGYLSKYPLVHHHLNTRTVRHLIQGWLEDLGHPDAKSPSPGSVKSPRLDLIK